MTDHSRSTSHDPVHGESTSSGYETDTSGSGGTGTSGTSRQAQQVVQEKVDQAKEVAQQAAGTAKEQASQQVDTHSTTVGEQVGSVSEAMRKAGEHLRSQGDDMPAQLAERAADQVQKLGSYLRNTEGSTILRDVEDFARRQPLIVVAGGVALGVLAARMLKASGQRSYGGDSGSFFRGSAAGSESQVGTETSGGGAATGAQGYTGAASTTYGEPVDTTTAGAAEGGWSGEPAASASGQWGTHTEPGTTDPGTAGLAGDQAETGAAGQHGWTGHRSQPSEPGWGQQQGWGQTGGDATRREG